MRSVVELWVTGCQPLEQNLRSRAAAASTRDTSIAAGDLHGPATGRLADEQASLVGGDRILGKGGESANQGPGCNFGDAHVDGCLARARVWNE